MLSVYLSGFADEQADVIRECLKGAGQTSEDPHSVRYSIEYQTENHQEMIRVLSKLEGISVIFVRVKGNDNDAVQEAIQVGMACARNNRDHYVIYVLPSVLLLADLAPYIFNISNVLLYPCDPEDVQRCMLKITEDYKLLTLTDEHGASPFVSLKYLGAIIRVRPNEIQYVEARDKKLEIHRTQKDLSIYENMNNMKAKLGNRFFHCHRSFLVNCDAIQRIDLPRMEIELFDGTVIPISRSCRNQAAALAETMLNESNAG